MAALRFLSILALSFIFASAVKADVLCPFDPINCKRCSGDDSKATTFEYAVCDNTIPGIPSFKPSPSGSKYTITGTLTMSPDVNKIEPYAFSAFDKIETLILKQADSISPVKAEWNLLAFSSVNISGIDVSGLDGLIPPNQKGSGLERLGENGLERLRIADCREAFILNTKYWSKFKTLSKLEIENTNISYIDDEAFVGLENTLEYLSLNSTSISTIPTKSLKNLSKLDVLILDGNPIEQLIDGSLQGLVSLEQLIIQNTWLTSLDLSAFNGLNALKALIFDSNRLLNTLVVSDLSKVPAKIAVILARNTNLTTLSPNFNDLLNRKEFLKLIIANSSNIVCDASIHWMAKYALCTSKLEIQFSQCANQEKSIEAYLSEMVPNACGVPTTESPPPTTTAKKSGSSLTASVFLTTSMIAVFTAAVKLI